MFIVFEGIDGCGKSTQIFKFIKYLATLSKYNNIVFTREPYRLREIREILKLDEKPEEKAEKLTELFVEDRKKHVDELIVPSLEKGLIVVCDRYKYSTICYQAAQGLDMSELIEMHKGMVKPDLVFIFDISVETAFERMAGDVREKEQKFEKDKEFLNKVRMNYLKMDKIFPEEKIFVIDATRSIEDIFKELKMFFERI